MNEKETTLNSCNKASVTVLPCDTTLVWKLCSLQRSRPVKGSILSRHDVRYVSY